MCEAANADVVEVAAGMGTDKRIGGSFLSAGLGLRRLLLSERRERCLGQWVCRWGLISDTESVESINEKQQVRFLKVRSALWTFAGTSLVFLGLAFKGGTDDIRESPAIRMVQSFIAQGCSVVAYDPAAMKNCGAIFAGQDVTFAKNEYERADGADALST